MAEQIKVKKNVKKQFFDVKSSLTSTKIQLYGTSAKELVDRAINLDLTRSLRGKSLVLKMKTKLEDESLIAEPVSLILVGSYIRRMMRTGTDYVEDSFEAESRDLKVRVKPFMITRNKVSRAVRNELRTEAKKFLESHLKTRTVKELFLEIMANKLQRELSLKLKKVYPLALCEIRHFEIV
jgi:ribosomal protein S3AE